MSSSLAYRFPEMKMICRSKIVDDWNLKRVPILRAQARLDASKPKIQHFLSKYSRAHNLKTSGKYGTGLSCCWALFTT